MTDLPDEPAAQATSTTSIVKEREVLPEVSPSEKIPIVEVGRVAETAAEQEGHIQRLEKELTVLEEPIKHEQTGEILIESAERQPKIVLPISKNDYLDPKNWHRPVVEAISWFLRWARRIIKMHPKEVVFEE